MKKNWMLYCLGFLLFYLLWLFKGDEVLGSDHASKDPIAAEGLPKDDSRNAKMAMHFTGVLLH